MRDGSTRSVALHLTPFRDWARNKDPETPLHPNGTAITTLSFATKESWKNADGEWPSRTQWHQVVCIGRRAEYAGTLAKGTHPRPGSAVRNRKYDDGMKLRSFELRPQQNRDARPRGVAPECR